MFSPFWRGHLPFRATFSGLLVLRSHVCLAGNFGLPLSDRLRQCRLYYMFSAVLWILISVILMYSSSGVILDVSVMDAIVSRFVVLFLSMVVLWDRCLSWEYLFTLQHSTIFAFFSGGGGGGGGGQKGGGSSLKSFRPGNPFGGIFADSADPAQTPQNAASGQGLHCVSTGTSVENTDKMKPLKLQMDPLKW